MKLDLIIEIPENSELIRFFYTTRSPFYYFLYKYKITCLRPHPLLHYSGVVALSACNLELYFTNPLSIHKDERVSSNIFILNFFTLVF